MRTVILAFGILFINPLFGQEGTNNSHNHFTSLEQIAQIIDTIDNSEPYATLRFLWIKDTIQVKRLIKSAKYPLEVMRKSKNDSTFLPSKEEEQTTLMFFTRGAQTCFSYAFEKYFKYNNINPDCLFNKQSTVDSNAVDIILSTLFKKTDEFSTSPKKNFKKTVENGTLILFKSKSDNFIHACFYNDGYFFSKNGMQGLKRYKKMSEVYDNYLGSEVVQIYEIDTNKVSHFIN